MHVKLADIYAEVVLKDIKNVHLSVYPPNGRVRIAAPRHMKLDTIRIFAIAKLPWIRQQQRRFKAQEREPRREYVERESHYVWGRRHLLTVVEDDAPAGVELRHRRITLRVRPGTPVAKRQEIVEEWYRGELRLALPPLIAKWESRLKVKVGRVVVRRMRTRWGSCNTRIASILLNTDLAKKPRECLEYILVHEMIHLLEPTHNARFVALMDHFMPKWQFHRATLNRLPVRHENWQF